jgi:PAS domain-containing protein
VISRRHSLKLYLPPAADLYRYFRIVCGEPRRDFASLPCLLARLWVDGRVELLSRAWNELGWRDEELDGRRFCDLMKMGPAAARATVTILLAEGDPVEFDLRRKDGSATRYHWNREFDDFTSSMFVIGDEIPAAQLGRKPARRSARRLERDLSV